MKAYREREEKLDWLHRQLADHLHEISKLWNKPMKLTLVARDPEHPDGNHDVLVGDDSAPEAIRAIELLATRPDRGKR